MTILALDVATKTGVAVGGPRSNRPTAWSVDLGKAQSHDRRFSNVLVLTHELIERHKPHLIVIEAPIGGRDASALLIGYVACIRGCAANRGIPIETFTSSSVRKHFLGRALAKRDFPHLNARAATIAIKQAVMDRCRLLGWDVPDADAADAAALWDCARATHGAQTIPTGGLFT